MPPRWLSQGKFTIHHKFVKFRCTSASIAGRNFSQTTLKPAHVTPLRKQLKAASKRVRLQSHDKSPGVKSDDHDNTSQAWELTVGIEIHAQLNTIRKLFSRARSENDGVPNESIAPFDVAVPGSQPLFQLSAIVPALRAALALNCHIESISKFDRKHYFYHDQPAGYQITQYYRPFARNGSILLTETDGLPDCDGKELVVGIKQVQLEQDTAKTTEQEDGSNMIDFTRSGQPLIEIISLPCIHSPKAAAAYLRKIQAILSSVDSVTAGMELGGLRADVNVSVRRSDGPAGAYSYSGITGLGQRTEIKNLSSFKAVEDAIVAERDRQIAILEAGGQIEGETRGWSQTRPNETRRLRGKEGEVDYRYMPDPDIPPLCIHRDLITYLKEQLPPVPEQLTTLLVDRYGLSQLDAKALIALDDGQRMIYFQDVVEMILTHDNADRLRAGKTAGNWVLHELGALLSTSETAWTSAMVPARSLARIIELQAESRISGPSAKRLLRVVFEGDAAAVDEIVTRENLWFEPMGLDELQEIALKVIEANPDTAQAIQKGNHKKIQFVVGQMMKTGDRNRIDAKQAGDVVRALLPENP